MVTAWSNNFGRSRRVTTEKNTSETKEAIREFLVIVDFENRSVFGFGPAITGQLVGAPLRVRTYTAFF
jgi:hypothetical protein